VKTSPEIGTVRATKTPTKIITVSRLLLNTKGSFSTYYFILFGRNEIKWHHDIISFWKNSQKWRDTQ
jgi:hypothetical protein